MGKEGFGILKEGLKGIHKTHVAKNLSKVYESNQFLQELFCQVDEAGLTVYDHAQEPRAAMVEVNGRPRVPSGKLFLVEMMKLKSIEVEVFCCLFVECTEFCGCLRVSGSFGVVYIT